MKPSTVKDATYWLLGLPFDLVTLDRAIEHIVDAARMRKRLIFATPNLSFLRKTASDSSFRDQVLATQLSLVDGMVLVWLGRLLGIPFQERVAGSDLIERMAQRPQQSEISICFFGGPPGAAENAAQVVNDSAPGLRAAGAVDPGYVDVSTMSKLEFLDAVNASRADLLCVSLGARKGHEWIGRNADEIDVPVISHLGAVVNFLAGSVNRAPTWMRKLGFEWIWRVGQEPALASRYAFDLLWLAQTVVQSVLPILVRRIFMRLRPTKPLIVMESQTDPDRLSLVGSLTATYVPALIHACQSRAAGTRLILDVSKIDDIDCRALGYLYALIYRGDKHASIEGANRWLRRLLHWHRAEVLLGSQGNS